MAICYGSMLKGAHSKSSNNTLYKRGGGGSWQIALDTRNWKDTEIDSKQMSRICIARELDEL